MATEPENPPLPGLTPLTSADPADIGRYRLVGRLGAGGTGVVYGAVDDTGGPLAVKVVHRSLSDDTDFRARFAREVDLVRRVRSACAPRFLDADTDADAPWLATEYVPGPTLRARVRAQGPLTGTMLTGLAAGVAEALQAVHALGIVHCNLKPGNIILAPDGPKVLDFGIARAVGETALAHTGGLVGTPGWIAPELCRGTGPTPAADVFSWGGVVAYAATGRNPFGPGEAHVLVHRTLEEPPDTDGVSPQLLPLVTAALDKDPQRRPDAAALLRSAVRAPERAVTASTEEAIRLLPDLLRTGWPDTGGTHTDTAAWARHADARRPPSPAQRALMITAGAVAVVLVVAGGWLAGSLLQSEDPPPDVTGTEAEEVDAGDADGPAPVESDRGGRRQPGAIVASSGQYETSVPHWSSPDHRGDPQCPQGRTGTPLTRAFTLVTHGSMPQGQRVRPWCVTDLG